MELPPADSLGWTFRPQPYVSQASFAPIAVAQFSGPNGSIGFYPHEQHQLAEVPSFISDGCMGQDQFHAAQQDPTPDGSLLERLPPRTDFEHLQQKYSELREAMDLWQRRANGAQQQVDATNSHLFELQRENWALGLEVVKLRQEVALLGGNISGQLSMAQGAVVSELQAQLAERLGQVGALQEEVGVLVAQLQAAERDAAAAAAAAAAERDRLAAELGTARLMATARGRGVEGLQAQLTQVSEAAEAEASDLRSQLAEAVARAEAAEVATAEATAVAEQQRTECEELRRQLAEEREIKERTAAELEVVRCDMRDLRAANECLEGSLESHLEGANNGGGTAAALLQLHGELRRVQSEAMAERHSLQEALAHAKEEARTAVHQVAYLRQLHETSKGAAAASGVVHHVRQPSWAGGPPQLSSTESLRNDVMPGCGSVSSSSCCGSGAGGSSIYDNDSSNSSSILLQQQQQQQQGHWPARVRELICSVQSLEEQLVSERDRADGLQRLVSDLQEQLQAALLGGGTEAAAVPFGGSGDGAAIRESVPPFHNEASGFPATGNVSEGGRTSSELDATAAMAEARSLAHSLFSDDDGEDGDVYSDGKVLGTGGSDMGRSWLDRTNSGPLSAPTTDAAVQTDGQTAAAGGEAERAAAAAQTTTTMLLTAAREEIERLKELNARLAAAKDPRRYVTVDKVQAALAEERQRVRQEADQAMAVEAAIASRRYEALAATHGSLQAEVQSLRSQLKAETEEAQVAREAKVSELQRRLDEASEQLEAAKEQAERLSEQLEQVRAEAEADAAAALVEAHAASAAATQRQIAALSKSLKEEHAAALEALRTQLETTHGSALAELAAQHEAQLEKLRQVHADEVSGLHTRLEEATAAAARKMAAAQEAADKLRQRHERELDSLRTELEATRVSAAAVQVAAAQQGRAGKEKDDAKATIAAEQQQQQQQQQLSEHLAKLSEDYQAQLAELRDHHVAEVDTLCEQHAAEVESLCKQHATEVEGLRKEHVAEAEGLRRQLREAAETAARRLADAEMAAQERERKLRLGLEATAASERLAAVEAHKRLDEELRVRHAEERQALELELARLRGAVQSLEEQLQLQRKQQQQHLLEHKQQQQQQQLHVADAHAKGARDGDAWSGQSEVEQESKASKQDIVALEVQLAQHKAQVAQQKAVLEALKEQHGREQAALQATHGSAMAEAAAQHAVDLQNLKRSHAYELGELRHRLETAHGSAMAQLEEELRRRYNAQMVEMRAELEATRESAVANADARHAAQIEELVRRQERELAALRWKLEATYGSDKAQAEKRHAAHTAELTRRHEQEVSALHQQHAAALKAAATAHAEQAAALADQYDMLYKERLAATAKALREAHQSELRRVAATMGEEAAAAAAMLREQMEAQVVEEVAAVVNTLQWQQHLQQRPPDGKNPAAVFSTPAPLGDRTNVLRAHVARPPQPAAAAAPSLPRAFATGLAGLRSVAADGKEPEPAAAARPPHSATGRVSEHQLHGGPFLATATEPGSSVTAAAVPPPLAASRNGIGMAGSGSCGANNIMGIAVEARCCDPLHGSCSSRSNGSTRSGGETDSGLARPPPPEMCSSPQLNHRNNAAIAAAVVSASNRASDGRDVPALTIPIPLHRTATGGGNCHATAAAAADGSGDGGGSNVLDSLLGRALLSSRVHRDRSLAQEAMAAQHATVAAQHEARLHSLRSGRFASSAASASTSVSMSTFGSASGTRSAAAAAAPTATTSAAPLPPPQRTRSSKTTHAAAANSEGTGSLPAPLVVMPAAAMAAVAARARIASSRSVGCNLEPIVGPAGLGPLPPHLNLEDRQSERVIPPPPLEFSRQRCTGVSSSTSSDRTGVCGKTKGICSAPAASLSLSDLSAVAAASASATRAAGGGGGSGGSTTNKNAVRSSQQGHRLCGSEVAAPVAAGTWQRGSGPGDRFEKSGSVSGVAVTAPAVAASTAAGSSVTVTLAQLGRHRASTTGGAGL